MPPRCPRGRTSRRIARSDGDPLEDHLPEEQHEHPRDVEAVRRGTRGSPGWRPCSASIRLTVRITWSASPESRLPRLAPPFTQQADAGRVPPLDLGAVGRGRARQIRPRLLLDPAERGDVVVRAEQDPGLARARLRREVGLPLDEAVRAAARPSSPSPARCRRASPAAAPGARARRSRGTGSRGRRCGPGPSSGARCAGHADRVGVVVVRPEDDVERRSSRPRRSAP